jgi:hypothetical protein
MNQSMTQADRRTINQSINRSAASSTHQVQQFQSLQKFAVFVFQTMSFINDNGSPFNFFQFIEIRQQNLIGRDEDVELVDSSQSLAAVIPVIEFVFSNNLPGCRAEKSGKIEKKILKTSSWEIVGERSVKFFTQNFIGTFTSRHHFFQEKIQIGEMIASYPP